MYNFSLKNAVNKNLTFELLNISQENVKLVCLHRFASLLITKPLQEVNKN